MPFYPTLAFFPASPPETGALWLDFLQRRSLTSLLHYHHDFCVLRDTVIPLSCDTGITQVSVCLRPVGSFRPPLLSVDSEPDISRALCNDVHRLEVSPKGLFTHSLSTLENSGPEHN